MLSFGAYPAVSLREARERRDEARKLVANHIDPSVKRKMEKEGRANTFAAVAREWLDTKKDSLSESTWQRDRDQLLKIVGPYLASRPIAEIEAPELLAILKRLEKRGVLDTAHRVRAVCGRVFRYAIATGRMARDISSDLKGALAPKRSRSYAAITDPVRVALLEAFVRSRHYVPAGARRIRSREDLPLSLQQHIDSMVWRAWEDGSRIWFAKAKAVSYERATGLGVMFFDMDGRLVGSGSWTWHPHRGWVLFDPAVAV